MSDKQIEFFAFENPPREVQEKSLEELSALMKRKDYAEPYYDLHGKKFNPPMEAVGGIVIEVLTCLKGLPVTNLIMAYVHALRPSMLRIAIGCVTCDCYRDRVTIWLDAGRSPDFHRFHGFSRNLCLGVYSCARLLAAFAGVCGPHGGWHAHQMAPGPSQGEKTQLRRRGGRQ